MNTYIHLDASTETCEESKNNYEFNRAHNKKTSRKILEIQTMIPTLRYNTMIPSFGIRSVRCSNHSIPILSFERGPNLLYSDTGFVHSCWKYEEEESGRERRKEEEGRGRERRRMTMLEYMVK